MLACRGWCCNPSGTAEACRTSNSAPSVCKWCTCGRGWWYVSPLLCWLPYIPLFFLLSPFSMWMYYSLIWILCPVISLQLTQDWPDYSPRYSCLFVTDTVAAQHSGRLKKLLKSRQAKSIPVDRSHNSELWTGWGVAEKYKLKWIELLSLVASTSHHNGHGAQVLSLGSCKTSVPELYQVSLQWQSSIKRHTSPPLVW
jgi:hypothetical protein